MSAFAILTAKVAILTAKFAILIGVFATLFGAAETKIPNHSIHPAEIKQAADNCNAAGNREATFTHKGTTMALDYLPSKDLDLSRWLGNFITVAGANEETLGLTGYDLSALNHDQVQLSTALMAINAAKLSLISAAKSKVTARKTTTADIRAIVKRIQSNPSIPDTLKSQLAITASTGGRTNTPPVMPTTLVATAHASGTNVLAWKRMGNKPNTQYVVYSKLITPATRLEADTDWTMVGQTTRSRFDHIGVTPGQPLAYRIVAARAQQKSAATAPVTVYTS